MGGVRAARTRSGVRLRRLQRERPGRGEQAWVSSVGAYPDALGGSVLLAGDGTTVYAFDAGGSAGCSDTVCAPLWSASGTAAIIANGIVYVGTANSGVVGYGLPG